MSKYGYVAHTFRVHLPRQKDPAPLDEFDGDRDALTVLYGILRGLETTSVTEKTRHLRTKTVTGAGRAVRFAVEIGHSGQTSQFFDPVATSNEPVFERADRHIETGVRRGLLVVPNRSAVGLLITEVQGRSGAKSLLAPTLSRIFRHYTEHILDIDAVVDEDALRAYLDAADVKEITLRRAGLPTDIADAVQFTAEDAEAGKLEMKIKPSSAIRDYQRRIVDRLRGDDAARRRLLQVHGLEFSELSVAMQVGERQTTLTVTADRIPSFVYDLPTRQRPSDDQFYEEVRRAVPEIGRAVGANVGNGWHAGRWSVRARRTVYAVPPEVAAGELQISAT